MVIGPAGKLAECRAKAKINNNNSPAAAQQSIDISCPPGPTALQQRTRSSGVRRPDGTDRQTDARPMHRPCSAYYAGSANYRSCCRQSAFTAQLPTNYLLPGHSIKSRPTSR